jgi:hypothetical protein
MLDLLLVVATLPLPLLRLVFVLVVVPRAVNVLSPRTMLVLDLVLHGLRALGDEVQMLPAPVAHARVPLSVLSVRVHVLEPLVEQREILLAQHIKLLI